MYTKPALSLSDVEALLALAKQAALAHDWKVSLAVVDDGGHVLGALRLDGTSPFTMQMATEKARTAALGRKESRSYEEVINTGRPCFLSAPLLKGMVEGGINIVVEGHTVGALGVSGVKSSEDALVARTAIEGWLGK